MITRADAALVLLAEIVYETDEELRPVTPQLLHAGTHPLTLLTFTKKLFCHSGYGSKLFFHSSSPFHRFSSQVLLVLIDPMKFSWRVVAAWWQISCIRWHLDTANVSLALQMLWSDCRRTSFHVLFSPPSLDLVLFFSISVFISRSHGESRSLLLSPLCRQFVVFSQMTSILPR